MFVFVIITSLVTFLIFILGTAAYLLSVIIGDSDEDRSASTLALDTQDFSRTPIVSPAELVNEGSIINVEELRASGAACNCLKALESGAGAGRRCHDSPRATCGTTRSVEGSAEGTGGGPAAAATAAATTTTMQQADDPAVIEADAQLLQGAALLADAAAVVAAPEELQSAEMNSRLLKGQQRRAAAESGAKSSSGPAPGPSDDQASESAGLSSWHSSAAAQKSIISGRLGSSLSKQIFDDFDSKEMQLGGTGLHWCKSRKSLDRLLKLGLPLDIVNKRQETALHVAVRRHKLQVLIGLLNNGANLESRNSADETPLILAAKVNDIFAVQLLLIYDADFNATDNLDLTARHHSATICDKHKSQQQLPSAAHLILAMLNEIGAKRCPIENPASASRESAAAPPPPDAATNAPPRAKARTLCTAGCAHSGAYNGNSYGRWPNFERESFNKRFMFADLIEARRKELASAGTSTSTSTSTDNGPARSRMLCMDGGGLRGVIVCQIMLELEKHLKRPMLSYFDWVGGTSVGAFIACALCLGFSLREMRRVCFEFKDEVFSGGRPYNSKHLERVLKRTYGPRTRLSEVKSFKLAFPTVLADRDPCQLKMFRSYKSASQVLEAHGFSTERYNEMSGHAVVTTSGKRNTVRRASSEWTLKTARDGGTPRVGAQGTSLDAVSEESATSVSANQLQRQQQLQQQGASGKTDGAPRTLATEAPTTKSLASGGALASPPKEAAKSIKQSEAETAVALATATLAKEAAAAATGESVLDENERDPIIWQAVRASAAAPFLFKPYGPFLDGGIISNNPTIDMLTEFNNYQNVRRFVRQHSKRQQTPAGTLHDERERPGADLLDPGADRLDLVVSLGTGRGRVIGRQAMVDFGQIASGLSAVFSPVELVRSIRAARDLFKRLMQQSCHTDDHILERAQAWCSSMEVPYFRLNPPLATIFSIDDKRDEQLINALWQTKLYMLAMRSQLVELAELLEGASLDRRTNSSSLSTSLPSAPASTLIAQSEPSLRRALFLNKSFEDSEKKAEKGLILNKSLE